MKILLLSDPASIHTVKWVNALCEKGLDIHLFGLGSLNPVISDKVVQHIVDIPPSRGNFIQKLKYLTAVPQLKAVYKNVQPDIVHAHFATSYGLLGRFLNHHPFIVSIWGSDVFDFPKKSMLHESLLKKIFKASDLLLSTSESMKAEGLKYTKKNIYVTPFGVDLKTFFPKNLQVQKSKKEKVFELGVVKALEKKYGIDILIRAFSQVVSQAPEKLRLTVVGGGSQMQELQELVSKENMGDLVEFTGPIPHDSVFRFHQKFDVEIFPSILDSESFGVSVVEAMACGTPVIVSDVSGFKEVVTDGKCGMVVERNQVDSLADAILTLIRDEGKMQNYMRKGLEKVQSHYDWNENVEVMVDHYQKLMKYNK